MSTGPTSAYTFSDLIKEVARSIGTGYYGATGDGVLDVPVDAYDLDQCKRLVNDGIRMFMADAPAPNGWRWAQPVATLVAFPAFANDTDYTLTFGTYDSTNDRTLLTSTEDVFLDSMEEIDIVVKDGGTYPVKQVVSSSTLYVYGDASAETAASEWSLDAKGNFTLPRGFSGDTEGKITFAAGTDRGIYLDWTDESVIREWRANASDNSGTPVWAAIRPFATKNQRRRWQLMTYPKADENITLEFRYTVGFDLLVDLTDNPPTPVAHDETIKAACLAVAERDVEDVTGSKMAYYQGRALANSYRIDRQSAPRSLGYFGNPGRGRLSVEDWRQNWMQRPDVTFNS